MYARLVAAIEFIKPEFWLDKAGKSAPYMVAAIIFAESGLFFGFFLPGDSLLFLTGFLTTGAAQDFAVQNGLTAVTDGLWPFPVLLVAFCVAAIAGDQVGYWFGRKMGPALFNRPDTRLFRQSHVTRAHEFLERHGPKTIFLARFVPIVRTFAPIVAGVGRMQYRTFLIYNVIGGVCWAMGITTLGRLLGQVGFVRDNIEYAIVAVILVSLTPVFIEFIKHRRQSKATVV